MDYSAVEKIPGGKLLSLDARVEEGVIVNVKITGDFFLHPEERVEALERACENVRADFDWVVLQRKLDDAVRDNGITLFGISTQDIVRVLAKALGGQPPA